jgi:hypothetical protein
VLLLLVVVLLLVPMLLVVLTWLCCCADARAISLLLLILVLGEAATPLLLLLVAKIHAADASCWEGQAVLLPMLLHGCNRPRLLQEMLWPHPPAATEWIWQLPAVVAARCTDAGRAQFT